MIKRIIRMANLIGVLCLLLSSDSSATGRKLTVYQDSQAYEWSIDLSDIEYGQAVYLVFPSDVQVDSWSELADKSLALLFEYAMPRFEFRYDTFDCWTRELILHPEDSSAAPSRGAGQIMGLPGQAIKEERGVRGQANMWDLLWMKEQEVNQFENGKYTGNQIIQITLNDVIKADKRVLRFRSNQGQIPRVLRRDKSQAEEELIHLFSMSSVSLLLPDEVPSALPNVDPYLLPSRINHYRRAFQDSVMGYWEGKTSPTLVYSWDIGTTGGDKCAPCIAPPPAFQFLQMLGVANGGDHLYIGYCIIPADAGRALESRSFQKFQYVFQMNEAAKGNLQCQEAKTYLEEIKARKKIEEANLEALFEGNHP